ncbi:MAG: 7-carboxy-7-deazaguanine synthase QueE [Rhizobiales bacterium]|nr:7-carboxy-7-deazaguanine synthase QueE [Hyphomicrobiales bacterium]
MKTIRVSEIFGPTIQGEGALIGEPTVFVRTGGCDYRCRWCDSMHAVDPAYRRDWRAMTTEAVFAKIKDLSGGVPLTVSLSGGNPAIQPLGDLIHLGHQARYRFALETQGSIAQDWFCDLDTLVLSPKPPSSGETVDWAAFEACLNSAGQSTRTVLKIVIFNEHDYEWARMQAARYPALPLYLQPGNHTPPAPEDGKDDVIDLPGIHDRMRWLVGRCLEDRWFDVHILPQLHVLFWGNKRGV